MEAKRVRIALVAVLIIVASIAVVMYFLFYKEKANRQIGDWQKEVLVAQECGLEGLSCCVGRDSECDGGLSCCYNPDGSGQNVCSESCENGKLGEYCRKDEPRCDSGLSCVDSMCVECGIVGNPCCEAVSCRNENSDQDDHAECFNGICELCGAAENRACLKGDCLPYNLLNNAICYSCGGFNQPCCQISSSTEYECDASKKLVCRLGFCGE